MINSKTFGNGLVIDEALQCTERDEFVYHEMMAHLPLFCHPNPKKVCQLILPQHTIVYLQVLIIGGGDGAAIREISKHSLVTEIHQCELDEVHYSHHFDTLINIPK